MVAGRVLRTLGSLSAGIRAGCSAAGRPSRCTGLSPYPVATTVTHTWSTTFSSTIAPKMMFASGCAASATAFAASLTSNSERSRPPVIESRIDRAPSTDVSRSGDSTAWRAASTARCSPTPMPIPSSDCPAFDMIVRTSAKSRLIRPGSVIRSEMPCTP